MNNNNNIIEGNRNRRRRRRREKKENLQNDADNLDDYYAISANYIASKDLTPTSAVLGPEYSYSDYIKGPKDLGMSSRGSMRVLEKDVNGLFSYVDLLIKGKSKAVNGGGILGPQNFVPTGATCQLDVGPNKERTVQRYIYNSFKPTGNIPIDGDDGTIKDARGLIPGLLENAAKLNPMDMFESLLDSNPKCMMLKMPTTTSSGSEIAEEYPVSVIDIGQMDPCSFKYYNNRNPVTQVSCGGGGGGGGGRGGGPSFGGGKTRIGSITSGKSKEKKNKRRSGFENIYDKTENIYDKTYVEIDDMFDTGELYVFTMSLIFIYVSLRACKIDINK